MSKQNITICFEGVDGAGKSSIQSDFKADKKIGYEQPYKHIYRELYDLLKTDDITREQKLELYHLQMHHLTNLIRNHEQDNYTIFIDRFYQSTYVYQNLTYKEYEKFKTILLKPDITFIFDIDWDTYRKRRPTNDTKDIYENNLQRKTFEERRARYKFLAETDEDTFLIDGTKSKSEVLKHIESIYREYLHKLHLIS